MRCGGLLVDIDGVLTVSWEPLPGAADALRRVRLAGLPVVFLTNTTSRVRSAIASALTDAGLPVEPEEILSAPAMTAAVVQREHPGARCLVVGSGDVTGDLEGLTLIEGDEEPDVVVLGGAGPELDYPTLNRVFRLAEAGTPLVAMHRNLFWSTREGPALDTGAFLEAIERAAGVEALVVGKPAPACFAAALDVLGIGPGDAVMVGDDLDADVLGAQAAGIRGVLVRTGKYRPETLARSGAAPDQVVDSFADVPALLGLG